jgi:dynein heavy chain
LKDLIEFTENEKDYINDETSELLQPYIDLRAPNGQEVFTGDVAKKSSAALSGLCVWVNSLSKYHKARFPETNKFPKPSLVTQEKESPYRGK